MNRLQATRALAVYPSDTAGIPEPSSLVTSGSSTSNNTNELIASGGDFVNNKVGAGHIVYNTTLKRAAVVVSVDSATTLTLSADIFSAASEDYKIFSKQTTGATFFVGVAGNVNLVTLGGDALTMVGLPNGYQPLYVKQIKSASTTATDIVALF